MTNFTTDALLAKASKYPTTDALPRHTAEGQKLARMAGDAHNIVGKHDMNARKDAHLKLAGEHRDIAASFKASGHNDLATLNAHAADLHEHAASENSGTDGLNARGATQQAVDATADANSACAVNDQPVAGVTWGKPIASGEITKGDTPGHEFHGNQYATVAGVGALTHSQRAKALAQRATEVRQGPAIQGNYREMATRHADLGNELNEVVRQAQANGDQDHAMLRDVIRGAQLAANAHFAAARAYDDIADGKTPYSAGDQQAQRDQAEALSHVAAMGSNDLQSLGRRANGSQ